MWVGGHEIVGIVARKGPGADRTDSLATAGMLLAVAIRGLPWLPNRGGVKSPADGG